MTHLQEVRNQITSDGIQSLYKLYHVRTPQSVMLRVLFNMLHAQASSNANKEERELLNYQQAIFELAGEEEVKNSKSGEHAH